MKTSNLHLRIRIARAKPYAPRTGSSGLDFEQMRAAQTKRQRKNLRHLLEGLPVVHSRKPSGLVDLDGNPL